MEIGGKTYTILDASHQNEKNSAGTWDAATAGNTIGTEGVFLWQSKIDLIVSTNNDSMGMSMFNA